MKLFAAVAVTAVLASPVLAAPCRDAKGHFIRCPPAASASATPADVKKDSKGRCRATGG